MDGNGQKHRDQQHTQARPSCRGDSTGTYRDALPLYSMIEDAVRPVRVSNKRVPQAIRPRNDHFDTSPLRC